MKLRKNLIFHPFLFVAVLIGALAPLAASRPAYAQAQRITVDGVGANGFACGIDGLCSSINVGRNGSQKQTETFMTFFSSRRDPITGIFTQDQGGGPIPNTDLTGDVPGLVIKDLSLNTDIARARAFSPDFFAFRIVCQPPPCPGCQSPCSGGPLLEGTLSATFTKTDAFTFSNHGMSEERFNLPDGTSLRRRSSGMSESASATWAVNFFGIPINTDFVGADIGLFRAKEITIEKTVQ